MTRMFTSHNLRFLSWKAEQDTRTSQVKQDTRTSQVKPVEKTETTDRETDSKVRGPDKKNTKRMQDTRQEKPARKPAQSVLLAKPLHKWRNGIF
jgi:hypothetical protein